MKLLQATQSRQNPSATAGNAVIFSKRRVALQMAGAFSFIVLAAILITVSQPSTDNAKKAAANPTGTVQLQVSHATNVGSGVLAPVTTSSTSADLNGSTVSPSVSTNVSTDGTGTTQVSVDGQSVNLPANGSYNKTVTTPAGSADVSVSNSTATSGNGSSYSHTFSHTSVDSSNLTIQDTTVNSQD
jgi:hypothetical protein